MQTTRIQPYTVMVVEDEATVSEVVATALVDEGYRVLTAKDGQDALDLVQRRPPDAIVLDLMLPNVDGWQVVKWCRAHLTTATIPIIVVSAAHDALEDGDIGSLVFMEKPFNLDVLLVLVEDAVSSPAMSAVA
jgi:DNA-binding response OmpR family regulator